MKEQNNQTTSKAMDANVREWYLNNYNDDKYFGDRIDAFLTFSSFDEGMARGIHPDDLLGVSDTVLRVRVLDELYAIKEESRK